MIIKFNFPAEVFSIVIEILWHCVFWDTFMGIRVNHAGIMAVVVFLIP